MLDVYNELINFEVVVRTYQSTILRSHYERIVSFI